MDLIRKKTFVSISLALTFAQQPAHAQFESTLDLATLDGTNGFTINGATASENSGSSVSAAGDINGDGIDDLIIGAWLADSNGNNNAGSSYVVFGSDSGLPNPLNLIDLNAINGFAINGVGFIDFSGNSVSAAGDVNGDGIDDLIIGAWGADPNGNNSAGSSYVVFGSLGPFPNPSNLIGINGTNGFIINGVAAGDQSGSAVSAAGDINGDGVDDLIIGADSAESNGNSFAGSSYVVFGSHDPLPNPTNLISINGLNGFTINGVAAFENSGHSVSAAGDINDDGLDDLIIGAFGAEPNGNSFAGSSYVVFGSDNPLPNPFNLINLNGTNGFSIHGAAAGDQSGSSVSTAGDVNGDGMDDLIIGAFGADSNGNNNAGSSYVLFGSGSGLPNPFNLTDLNGTNGFTINGVLANDHSGYSVSAAGDINGDGLDDLIIGAPSADPNGNSNAGSSYVVFGSESPFPNPLNLIDLNGTNGFTINGLLANDSSGLSVSAAGDINGDGIDDLIIGANGADPNGNSNAGSSYVVFGTDVIIKNGFE